MIGEVFTGDVLWWRDGQRTSDLESSLRSRPGYWAVVATGVHRSRIQTVREQIRLDLDEFEVQVSAVDDDIEWGLLYEAEARYVGRNGEHLPSWERED